MCQWNGSLLEAEATSRVACTRACILIGLICSTIGQWRLIKKLRISAIDRPADQSVNLYSVLDLCMGVTTIYRCQSHLTTPLTCQSPHDSADLPESPHISADLPESPHVSADLPESPHVSADLPESPHVSADLPESPHVSPHALVGSCLICPTWTWPSVPSPGSTSAPPPSWIVPCVKRLEAALWGGALS